MTPKKIFLTVDTECHDIRKVNQYFYGDVKGQHYGVQKILELAKQHDIVVNFFVDVVEAKKYGNDHIQAVVDLINAYGQPVFFHLHPDYLSGDSRTFLWEYSYQEQKEIIAEGLQYYKKFAPVNGRLVFRAGRYGVNSDTYKVLSELGTEVLDLSYIYDGRKMCKISADDLKTANRPVALGTVLVLPNTRFIVFDYFGRKKCVGLDSADATFSEFREIVKNTKLSNLVYTMHSWNFIKKWFFLPNYVSGDEKMVKKFHKSVEWAKKQGFSFDSLDNFEFVEGQEDEVLNLCAGFGGKCKGVWNNFLRFQRIARLNKKYFVLYSVFYIVLFLCILRLLLLVV